MKIGTLMMLDSYTNSMCLESWGRSSYARILIEIDVCNGFSDNLVMAIHNLEGPGYSKETIRVEYEWEPPRCSTCLLFGHSVDDCPKAPKQIVNRVDKGKCGSSGADDEGFVKVKKKKLGGENGGTKNFKPISVKQKTQYRPKVNQSTEGNNGKKNVSTSGNSSKRASMTNASTSGNGTFPLSNSFKVLNVDDPANVKVESDNKASTSKGTCLFVDDDGKPLKKVEVDYLDDHDGEDEVEPVDNEMAKFLASKQLVVGYGTKSLLEQYRETYENVEYDYDPYDDDLYEGREIPGHIQFICDNFDIKVLDDDGPKAQDHDFDGLNYMHMGAGKDVVGVMGEDTANGFWKLSRNEENGALVDDASRSVGGVWDKPWDMTYGNGFVVLGGISFKEDRVRVVWMEVGGGVVRAKVVSSVVVKVVLIGWEVFERWFWMGELSLEDMSMKSVHGIFFRGFWVEELALEAIEQDDQEMEILRRLFAGLKALEHSLSLLEFRGISSFDGWKLVHVGNRIKSVVVNGIILNPLVRSRRR
ncbi:retrovirus-related pol polyprotein from transposon TNT 1-94 [Tanacetum coccineum]